jgi:hypothetical protein
VLSLSLPLWILGRNCSALFSNFVEEKTSNNKKDIEFLLVSDKGYSYTERFLAFLPCTCVLQPEMVHLYHPASILSGSFAW